MNFGEQSSRRSLYVSLFLEGRVILISSLSAKSVRNPFQANFKNSRGDSEWRPLGGRHLEAGLVQGLSWWSQDSVSFSISWFCYLSLALFLGWGFFFLQWERWSDLQSSGLKSHLRSLKADYFQSSLGLVTIAETVTMSPARPGF